MSSQRTPPRPPASPGGWPSSLRPGRVSRPARHLLFRFPRLTMGAGPAQGPECESDFSMQFQIDVSSTSAPRAADPSPPLGSPETLDLLRQILEVQREQLAYQKATLQA